MVNPLTGRAAHGEIEELRAALAGARADNERLQAALVTERETLAKAHEGVRKIDEERVAEIKRLRAALAGARADNERLRQENAKQRLEAERLHRLLGMSGGRELSLRAMLKELADDMEDELRGHYAAVMEHPAMRNKFDRDMVPVLEARRLLDGEHVVTDEERKAAADKARELREHLGRCEHGAPRELCGQCSVHLEVK